MAALTIPARSDCRWDCAALGEVLLRLDPGPGRVRTARRFDVWEGGGEYNVARALCRTFGLSATILTAVPDSEVGQLLEDLMRTGGVDLSHVKRMDYDGVGRHSRVGLNFTERGFGPRPAKGMYDRAHSAASALASADVDWEQLLAVEGVRWLHTGGIYAALSDQSAEVVLDAVSMAREYGTIVSYDLNYRASLWKDQGGQKRAIDVNRAIAPYVDVMIGNEEDFTAALGFEVDGTDEDYSSLDTTSFIRMIERVVSSYPQLQVVATTLRDAKTANVNGWGAVAYANGRAYEATRRDDLAIYDRVGGGDGFASGLIYGLLQGKPVAEAVEYGAAHGALVMSTPGDYSMVSLHEVELVMSSRSARAIR